MDILQKVQSNTITLQEAYDLIKTNPYDDLGFAKIDNYRYITSNYPEVVFCQGKTTDQLVKIFKTLFKNNNSLLGTRIPKDVYDEIKSLIPELMYNETAQIIYKKIKLLKLPAI